MRSVIRLYIFIIVLIVLNTGLKADGSKHYLKKLWEGPEMPVNDMYFDEAKEEFRIRTFRGISIYDLKGTLKADIDVIKTVSEGRKDSVRVFKSLGVSDVDYSCDMNCFSYITMFKNNTSGIEVYVRDENSLKYRLKWSRDIGKPDGLFKPYTQRVVAVSSEGAAVVWGRHPSGNSKQRLVIFDDQGKEVAVMDEGEHGIFTYKTPQDRNHREYYYGIFNETTFSPDGSKVYVCARADENIEKVRLIVLKSTGKMISNIMLPIELKYYMHCDLKISPDGNSVIFRNYIYRLNENTIQPIIQKGGAKFTKDGDFLIVAAVKPGIILDSDELQLIDKKTLEVVFRKELPWRKYFVSSKAAFNAQSDVIAANLRHERKYLSDNELWFFYLNDGRIEKIDLPEEIKRSYIENLPFFSENHIGFVIYLHSTRRFVLCSICENNRGE